MDLLGFIGNMIKPVADTIDKLHTSEQEKLELRNQFETIKNSFATKLLEYESMLAESRSKVIETEAKGESWLQRNWRPLMMVSFGGIVVSYFYGWAGQDIPSNIVEELFSLLKLGIGGYIVGRSGEKVIPKIVESVRKRD